MLASSFTLSAVRAAWFAGASLQVGSLIAVQATVGAFEFELIRKTLCAFAFVFDALGTVGVALVAEPSAVNEVSVPTNNATPIFFGQMFALLAPGALLWVRNAVQTVCIAVEAFVQFKVLVFSSRTLRLALTVL